TSVAASWPAPQRETPGRERAPGNARATPAGSARSQPPEAGIATARVTRPNSPAPRQPDRLPRSRYRAARHRAIPAQAGQSPSRKSTPDVARRRHAVATAPIPAAAPAPPAVAPPARLSAVLTAPAG